MAGTRHHAHGQASVLAQGEWYQISIESRGVYKITATQLRQIGINPDQIDPRKIQLFGNGGKMLPQKNSHPRATDLQENALWVLGEEDGRFDPGDAIIFYADGPDSLWHHPDTGFDYQRNPYSDKAYYYLTVGQSNGKRITTAPNPGTPTATIETYDHVETYERDFVNLLSSGREWWGELFEATTTRNFSFPMEGVVPGQPLQILAEVMGQSLQPTQFRLAYNSQQIGEIPVDKVNDPQIFRYDTKGIVRKETFHTPASAGSNQIITLTFDRTSPGLSRGYLNYLVLSVPRHIQIYGTQSIIRSLASTQQAVSSFKVNNPSAQLVVWDVSQPRNSQKIPTTLENGKALFTASTELLKTFVLFHSDGNLPSPQFERKIPNQNLRSQSAPDFLIITHPLFAPQAERLAQHRRIFTGLEVSVVSTDQLYHEFGSGSPDPTALRDAIRHWYLKDPAKLKNVLLFGKCSYDYKNRISNNTNFVPTYSSRNSLHPLQTYSSDDYFGFMDPEEGDWQENSNDDHMMDLGIGRLPVTTQAEAHVVVNKLIRYDQPTTLGAWRKQITFVADDGDFNIHQQQANRLTTYIDTTFAGYSTNKIYLDAFPQITLPNGERAPEVNKAITKAVEEGSLIINYAGHGNPIQWAAEEILNFSMIESWSNPDKMPFFVTATCDFGVFDNPAIKSGGERILLKPEGGAIGLVTTARPVNSATNFELNRSFYFELFQLQDGAHKSMGEIFKNTKNESLSGVANRSFTLLGDPSMTLAFPKNEIIITEINSAPPTSATVNSLSEITIRGIISNDTQQPLTHFSGEVWVQVFDKPTTHTTLGNESAPFQFQKRDVLLFQGKASIHEGEFELDWFVSKNINYALGKGHISAYALNSHKTADALGGNNKWTITGTNPEPRTDNQPPDIRLYLNDTNFQSGDLTGTTPLLLAHLQDESGINISGYSLANNIVATINDQQTVVLNQYFTNETDTYQEGWVVFRLPVLPKGKHTLTFSASDNFNNVGTAVLEFIVSDGPIVIHKIYNYPNPVKEKTTIGFNHNRPGEDLEARLKIVGSSGKEVANLNFSIPKSPSEVDLLQWEAQAIGGQKLPPGIYVYEIEVLSRLDGLKSSRFQKLIIIN
jgi:hypothetical protein